MATKKTVAGRISGRRGNPKTNVKRLAKKARAEVAALLKSDRADTLTGKRLKTGLERVEERLDELDIHLGDI